MATDNSAPRILIICSCHESYFERRWDRLLPSLRSKATVEFLNNPNPDVIVQLLADEPMPSAILITDEGLYLNNHAHLWDAVLNCVRQGCTAIVMKYLGQFPSRGENLKPFFSQAGLPWEEGSYLRRTSVINDAATGHDLATKLPQSYSQRALFVKNVAYSDAWYMPDDDLETRVAGLSVDDVQGESPVALARVGEGRLGYVGDFNAEEETDVVILAMCGLLE
ncbi:uncharacterized protein N7503_010021 [Penicillium pulvis]|uniref:uncharacterized protein n=1 Tax=Penicillium pulvis TaxID=1562058 RepID=UPI0025483ECB|nr:uncharacterized protein N7503_010021 [Penicillium pulvis]KAJ5784809.1 hypothetical protein N7503_010021 [Penicillium pulvis]